MSGFAASASRIGSPDLGLMTFSEVFDQANNICNAIDIPMIVDGDTGYGNAMNVRRTLKECSKAGCAGILIEDQLVYLSELGELSGQAAVNIKKRLSK